jgi:flagellar biosynthesis chaperone FliJ
LLALRTVEEEQAEAEASRQRRIRQLCLDAMRASEERSADALRALHTALHSGDRTAAISAEMALAFGPLERNVLKRQISHFNPIVDAATNAWRNARICRMQMETLARATEAKLERETMLAEQKERDMWFLAGRAQRVSNESFQREEELRADDTGNPRAGSSQE